VRRRFLPRVLLATAWQNHRFALAVAGYARQAGWHLDLQMELSGEVPRDWNGEGVITLLGGRQDLSRFVQRVGCPTVCATLNEPALELPRVDVDCVAIGRLAAIHFLEKGFANFAWYSDRYQVVEQLRCDSFSETVSQAGRDCTRLVWEHQQGRRKNTWANRQVWLARKLSQLPRPLAVFSVDDTNAVEIVEAAARAELTIPDQVAVLGTGDLDLFRESTPVTLSSVQVDFDRLAREATILLDRLMNGAVPPAEPILIPPSGIASRHSTDTIAVEHPQVARAVKFMIAHFAEPVGAREIVGATEMSQSRLYKAFQQHLGMSPVAVLARIRLEKAERLLRDTPLKIRVIADECGFGDPINLYRAFQRRHGVSPRYFRRSIERHQFEDDQSPH